MIKVLGASFFNRDAKVVAQELLGKFLVRKMSNNKKMAAIIIQTEAYDGPYDLASHASKGRTKRTKVMFGNSGIFYVYLCYGMHYMLNVVTGKKNYPAAVLIRGVALGKTHLNGPGKLTKFLKIDKNFNGKKAEKSTNLWFEDRPARNALYSDTGGGVKISELKIKKMPRIGVTYAGPVWSSKKLRFVLETME